MLPPHNKTLTIIGGGPAGLMAAEAASATGVPVHLYDAMPSVGRKFLLTGKGGLNITHSEPFDQFKSRYRPLPPPLEKSLDDFGPEAVRHWVGSFGIETVTGSSGRVFPRDFKAAPLLRAWQRRLREAGVQFHTRHRWRGWDSDGALRFDTPTGVLLVRADAVVLALGGASWPRLGSDGAWVAPLSHQGILIAPLAPANCRFECGSFSKAFCERYAGTPVKNIRLHCQDHTHTLTQRAGELVITANGIEGGPVYALSSLIRQTMDREGVAEAWLDLCPDRTRERLQAALQEPRGSRSLSGFLQRKTGLEGIKLSLLRECLPPATLTNPEQLARAIKALPLTLTAPGALETAISTAGGIRFDQLNPHLMLVRLPGIFVAGEMLDYDAPTGGYLLTACLATGRTAGRGASEWLMQREVD